jgi:hypothetical protein
VVGHVSPYLARSHTNFDIVRIKIQENNPFRIYKGFTINIRVFYSSIPARGIGLSHSAIVT